MTNINITYKFSHNALNNSASLIADGSPVTVPSTVSSLAATHLYDNSANATITKNGFTYTFSKVLFEGTHDNNGVHDTTPLEISAATWAITVYDDSTFTLIYTRSNTGLYSKYNAVFTALEEALSAESTLKSVKIGERYSYKDGLPAAVINVENSQISQSNMDQLMIQVNFEVMLICRTIEPDDWFDDVIKVMCNVFDAVIADRTLNGSVADITPTGFVPGEINDRTVNKTFYGGVLRFSAYFYF
jgi:hypothetical protein